MKEAFLFIEYGCPCSQQRKKICKLPLGVQFSSLNVTRRRSCIGTILTTKPKDLNHKWTEDVEGSGLNNIRLVECQRLP